VLANPIRLKIIALLAERPRYPYELAKELKLSYPLTYLHLSALERAGLVETFYEPGPRTKKYYRIKDFKLILTPDAIRRLIEK